MMKNVFWNQDEQRLRLLWRLILHGILLFILALFFTLPAAAIGGILLAAVRGLDPDGIAAGIADRTILNEPIFGPLLSLATLVAIVVSVWLAGRLFDRRRFTNFGLQFNRHWLIDFAFGLALGALLMALVFAVQLAAGWITISGTLHSYLPGVPFAVAILAPLINFICVGIYEELLFRGYYLKNVSEGFRGSANRGLKNAIILATLATSAVFGLAHAANPHATPLGAFNIFLAGLFLALGYVLTGQLAIPIGLHITWNFFQGNVFGFPVSGLNTTNTTFIAIEQGGDPLLTGGAFGPEGGLIGTATIALGSLLIILWLRLRYGRARLEKAVAIPEFLPGREEEIERLGD